MSMGVNVTSTAGSNPLSPPFCVGVAGLSPILLAPTATICVGWPAAALRNGAPFKDWLLPAAMAQARRVADGSRQVVDILDAVLTDWNYTIRPQAFRSDSFLNGPQVIAFRGVMVGAQGIEPWTSPV
jgi:hypothetical protein